MWARYMEWEGECDQFQKVVQWIMVINIYRNVIKQFQIDS